MKKASSLFIGLFFTAVAVSAQSWSKTFQFGIKGGFNFSNAVGDDYESPDERTGFYAGFLAEAPISYNLSLQPEAFYSSQGFELIDGNSGIYGDFRVDYIQVPVILKVYLINGLNLQAGPQFGFKVHENVDVSTSDVGFNFDTDTINDFDMQLTGGLEYKFGEIFFVQGRYSYGFSDIVEDTDVHNSVFSVGLGIVFH